MNTVYVTRPHNDYLILFIMMVTCTNSGAVLHLFSRFVSHLIIRHAIPLTHIFFSFFVLFDMSDGESEFLRANLIIVIVVARVAVFVIFKMLTPFVCTQKEFFTIFHMGDTYFVWFFFFVSIWMVVSGRK